MDDLVATFENMLSVASQQAYQRGIADTSTFLEDKVARTWTGYHYIGNQKYKVIASPEFTTVIRVKKDGIDGSRIKEDSAIFAKLQAMMLHYLFFTHVSFELGQFAEVQLL